MPQGPERLKLLSAKLVTEVTEETHGETRCNSKRPNVGTAIINLPFWDGLHHLFMVVFGDGLLFLCPHYAIVELLYNSQCLDPSFSTSKMASMGLSLSSGRNDPIFSSGKRWLSNGFLGGSGNFPPKTKGNGKKGFIFYKKTERLLEDPEAVTLLQVMAG